MLVDVQELDGGSTLDWLDGVLRWTPDGVRVVLVSRHDPAVALQRLRLEEKVGELRLADLAVCVLLNRQKNAYRQVREAQRAHVQPFIYKILERDGYFKLSDTFRATLSRSGTRREDLNSALRALKRKGLIVVEMGKDGVDRVRLARPTASPRRD